MTADWFPNAHSQVWPVILASSEGSRLFPLTSKDSPKHLLPIAGIPSILRLLKSLSHARHLVICIASDDCHTMKVLEEQGGASLVDRPTSQQQQSQQVWTLTSTTPDKQQQSITVVKLEEDCPGSVDAIRQIEKAKIIPESCHILVLPGDLVVLKETDSLFPNNPR